MFTRDRTIRTLGSAITSLLILIIASGCPRSAVPDQEARPTPPEQEELTDTGQPLNDVLLKNHALVIGINDYHHHQKSHWDDLRTAREDAVAIADVLRTEYAFDVTTLLDREATRENIMASLSAIMSLGSNDAAIVYFAGHGYLDTAMDEGHWIPSDAKFKGTIAWQQKTGCGIPPSQRWLLHHGSGMS